MRKRVGTAGIFCIVALFAVCEAGCSRSDVVHKAEEDEINLNIQLDLKEDIGLLILDINVNGVETSGGVSNANQSPLKHDDAFVWTLSREDYDNPVADTVDLSVRFSVITEYVDPNYENDYPEEYTILLDAVSFKADFGDTYHITITGDKDNGYQALLDEP